MKEAEALSGLVEICLFIVPSFLLRLRCDNADKLLFSSGFDSSAVRLICSCSRSRLMGPPHHFLEGLAGFYAILAEIRNCLGVEKVPEETS